MKGILSPAQISLSLPATSMVICSDSTTQVPAIRNRGWSRPTLNPQSCMSGSRHLLERVLLARGLVFARRFDISLEQRMTVTRRRGELGVELDPDEPRMDVRAQLHHLGQVFGRRTRADDHAARLELGYEAVVDFIAMAM